MNYLICSKFFIFFKYYMYIVHFFNFYFFFIFEETSTFEIKENIIIIQFKSLNLYL